MGRTILHISTRLILGGSQENTVLSCIGQSKLGHRVHLAYGPIFGPEGSHKDSIEAFNARVRNGEEPGATEITLHELPNMVREINPYKDHFCFHHDLKRLIQEVRPDIVHTHSSKAGILGRWAAWKVRKDGTPRVVHTIHGPPFMPVEGGAIGRAKVRLKNTLYTHAERFAAKRCDFIVSVADAMTDQFRSRRIGNDEQFITVRSGMLVDEYLHANDGESREAMRAKLGIQHDEYVLGTVARLAQHKGHDDILDALSDDLKDNPNWKLLWVGDGWWSKRLMSRARSLGLERQVIHTGLVPQHQVASMVRAMDVLVHPSYREGLPRTVPQALLCGVPVIASSVDGTPEVCIDERASAGHGTGLLFGAGDTQALRACVRWMFEHPEHAAQMGARGRTMCAEMFSVDTMVQGLESVYERSIGLG